MCPRLPWIEYGKENTDRKLGDSQCLSYLPLCIGDATELDTMDSWVNAN